MERSITETASGSSSVVAVLNLEKQSIATTSIPSRQVWCRSAGETLDAFLERPSSSASRRERAGAVADGVDDHGPVLVTLPCVLPDVLTHADHADTVEAGRIGDEQPVPLGQDPASLAVSPPRVPRRRTSSTGGRPRCPPAPAQSRAGELGPRFGRGGGVMATHDRNRYTGTGAR